MPVAANTTESACDDGSQGAAPGDSLATGVVYAELFWRCRPEDLPAPPKPPGPGQVTTTLLSPTYLVPTPGRSPVSKTRPVADAGSEPDERRKGNCQRQRQHRASTTNREHPLERAPRSSACARWSRTPSNASAPGKKIPVTANVQLSSDGKTATFGSTTNVPIGEACRVTGWHIVLPPPSPRLHPGHRAPSYTYDPKQPTVDVR